MKKKGGECNMAKKKQRQQVAGFLEISVGEFIEHLQDKDEKRFCENGGGF
jgi:hypothetical protein